MPLARRSPLQSMDRHDHLQPLQQVVEAPYLQRIFEKMAAAGPVPEELCINTSHVKAHRSSSWRRRSGAAANCEHRQFANLIEVKLWDVQR